MNVRKFCSSRKMGIDRARTDAYESYRGIRLSRKVFRIDLLGSYEKIYTLGLVGKSLGLCIGLVGI